MVRVAALLAVLLAGLLVALLDVRVRVQGLDHGRPVPLHEAGEDVDERVVVVRDALAHRGAGGDDGAQVQRAVPPQAGEGAVAPPGVHGEVQKDQLDAAEAVGEGVDLGRSAAVQRDDAPGPLGEDVEPEQGRVGLAQALVAGGGVRGPVAGHVAAPGYVVPAVVLARGDVDADHRDPGVQHPLGVGVHEEQIVVRVGQYLHQPRPTGAGDGHAGCRVGGGVRAARGRHGAEDQCA